jgi:integrase
MTRVHIPHLERRRQRRKDGSWGKTSWWWAPSKALRRAGWAVMRLPDARAEAELMAMRQNADVERWRRQQADVLGPALGTVAWLITKYLGHRDFERTADATKRGYRQALTAIEAWAGDMRVQSVTPVAVEAWLEGQAAAPAQANARLRVLRILLKHGQRLQVVETNAARLVSTYRVEPREAVWSHEQEDRWCETALGMGRPSLVLAYALAVYTLQRQTDVLRLTWSQDCGNVLFLRQSKTGTRVEVPILTPLRRILDATPRTSVQMVVSEATRKPYQPDHFRHEIRAVTKASGLDGLWFRDLRRTGAVRLAEAGVEAKDIAEWGGWSDAFVSGLIRTYIPRGRRITPRVIDMVEAYYGRKR